MKRIAAFLSVVALAGCVVVVDDDRRRPPPVYHETQVVYVPAPPPPEPPPPPPPLPPEPPPPPPPPPPLAPVEVTVVYQYQPVWEDSRVILYREYFGCAPVTFIYIGRMQAQLRYSDDEMFVMLWVARKIGRAHV